MDNSFTSVVDSANSILILLPSKPYFDQVAAGLALYLSLRDKKETSIICPSEMVVNFNRLIGVNKIGMEAGNKNLVISFPNYKAENIEKVSYDIENGEFKLTVSPKTGFTAPQSEQINITHSGVAADLIILVGGANESHFPTLASKDLETAKVAHIGTRVLEISSGRGVMSFAKPASSVSELVTTMIKDGGLPMDSDTATNLVMGIEDGGNHFEGADVTAETFETFAYLLKNGGQRLPKRAPAGAFPPGSIPGQPIVNPIQEEVVAEQIENKEQPINPPTDWLGDPKIYKGTSVS